MKKLLGVCVAVLFVIGVVLPVYAADTNLVLATGGTAGTYYPFGGAMARIWNTKIPGMNVTAQTTGASAENIRLVNKKEVELALVQSDTLDFAYNAKEAFKEPIKTMSAIAVLYPEIIQVVTRADYPIKSITDLKGKKVGVGAPGSGTEANFRQLMDVYGLAKGDVNSQYLSFSESAEAFKDRHIDAFIVTAGIPNAAIMDISTQNEIRIINIPAETAAKLTVKYPFLAAVKVPANTYKSLTQDVETVAVNAVLIVGNDVSADVVYNMTKALFDNQAELASAHAKGKELNLQNAVKGVSIPFHPGAMKYYKEKGAIK
ncbi:MAG: TAXI family TRAP transporter solute-binding subunit [Proteobacteria bacterium]|nr:TAXI family TRAP transporter solute-binding subunit [Pseudomonadota bacterium]MBU1711680.1 TAXI family TRAP transporter solute-binding subunit [Pseudomonadota bacterium]